MTEARSLHDIVEDKKVFRACACPTHELVHELAGYLRDAEALLDEYIMLRTGMDGTYRDWVKLDVGAEHFLRRNEEPSQYVRKDY